MSAHDTCETAADHLARFGEAEIVVVGDIMLDRTVEGQVSRICPEAPVPVLHDARQTTALGGAGNVVRNIVSLGGNVVPVAVVGADHEGNEVRSLLGGLGCTTRGVVSEAGRPTTVKMRFASQGQQMLRVDTEATRPLAETTRERLLAAARAALATADVLVVADYAKGVVSPALTGALVAEAAARGVPVVVDPKAADFARYRGADFVTPNEKELAAASGRPCGTDAETLAAARALASRHGLGAVLATRSEKGMMLVPAEGAPAVLRALAREVVDITGAGDTVSAAFALGLAAGMSPSVAAHHANVAAGIVVQKRGTAHVGLDELVRALSRGAGATARGKVMASDELARQLARCRAMGLRIGFTNGCFDLLHPGHLALLHAASEACDFLVVGINGDASVQRLKGEGRPVQPVEARAAVLAALGIVGAVTVFDEDTPETLIRAVRPAVLVKGADYAKEDVVGAAFVESYGGEVRLAPLLGGHSTTAIVGRMARREPA